MLSALFTSLSKRLLPLIIAVTLLAPAMTMLATPAQAQTVEKTGEMRIAEQTLKNITMRIMQANGIDTNRISDIQVIEGEDYNAATDGQIIYFTLSLFRATTTDDQKAFILAHEMSHVTLGHHNKTAVRRVGLTLLDRFVLARVGSSGRTWEQLRNLGVTALDTKFSRTMEYQADDRGIQYMAKAGYNPQAALQVFDILQSQDKSGTPQFLRSHPLSKNRIQQLAKKYGLNAR